MICQTAEETPSTESLLKLLEHALKLNNVMCNGEHYIQISGTAMCTKMAPPYANIFIGRLKWIENRDCINELFTFGNSFQYFIEITIAMDISSSKMYFWTLHQLWKIIK